MSEPAPAPALGPTRSEFDALCKLVESQAKRIAELEDVAAKVKAFVALSPPAPAAAPAKRPWWIAGKGGA